MYLWSVVRLEKYRNKTLTYPIIQFNDYGNALAKYRALVQRYPKRKYEIVHNTF